MMNWRRRGWMLALLALVVLLILAACGDGGSDPTAEQPGADGGQGAEPGDNLPTNLPVFTPTEPGPAATQEPAGAFDENGLPIGLTGYEIIAANAGEAMYSGYSCDISTVGCACETPIFERVQFTFPSVDRSDYRFAGEGYETTWELTRVGASQWSYRQLYSLEGTEISIDHSLLLTFIDTGYIRNELARFDDGTIITCPDVYFRRISSSAQPTAAP